MRSGQAGAAVTSRAAHALIGLSRGRFGALLRRPAGLGVSHVLVNRMVLRRVKKVFVEGYGPEDLAADLVSGGRRRRCVALGAGLVQLTPGLARMALAAGPCLRAFAGPGAVRAPA